MTSKVRHLPSTRCLTAFEAAARNASFTAAAAELNTSQSAISRQIAELEQLLGTDLFIREKQRVRLSEPGDHLLQSVRHGLESIRSGLQVVADWGGTSDVVIACTHAVSHLVLMPRFEALQAAMGTASRIRIMTIEYDVLESLQDPQVDIVFAFDPEDTPEQDHAVILREAVMPVCSTEFLELHADRLAGPLRDWADLPLLDMTEPGRGGARWTDWFGRFNADVSTANTTLYDNYAYLLEAASSGRGVALGMRGLIERHLAAGALVPARGPYVPFDSTFDAILTSRGRGNPAAKTCLGHLAELFRKEGLAHTS